MAGLRYPAALIVAQLLRRAARPRTAGTRVDFVNGRRRAALIRIGRKGL